MASFSVSERNRDDVGVRGKMKKDKSPNTTVKIPSYEYKFHQFSGSSSDRKDIKPNEGNYTLE